MVTTSRHLPFLVYVVIGLMIVAYEWSQIRAPVGAMNPPYNPLIPWSDALQQIEILLVSSIALFVLGVAMIYWTAGLGKVKGTRKEEASP